MGLPPLFDGGDHETLTPLPLAGLTAGAGGASGTVADDGALTVRLTVVEWVTLPLVPVIVIVDVAAGVEVVTVKVDVDEVGFGEKLPPAPEGRPLDVRVTDPAPPVGTTVTSYVVEPPAVTVRDDGVAEIVKSGVGVAPQPGNLNDVIHVLQFQVPFVFRYSFVYQNVQSSTGSTVIEL